MEVLDLAMFEELDFEGHDITQSTARLVVESSMDQHLRKSGPGNLNIFIDYHHITATYVDEICIRGYKRI